MKYQGLKLKSNEMKFVSSSVKEVMKVLNIKNEDQLKVWMKWYLEDACTRSGLSKCWKRTALR